MKKIFSLSLLFIFFVSVSLSASTPRQSKTINSADGTPIFYSYTGGGDVALVFVHGWSCDVSYWKNQMDYFGEQFLVAAVDLAGHGASGTNRINYTPQSFAKDVKAVIDDLKTEKVILVGHSMGGAVVIETANLLADKVIGIIGADTFQDFTKTFPEDMRENFLAGFRNNFSAQTVGFVKNMFPATADSVLVASIAEDMSSAPPKIAVSALENLFKYNPVETLKNISVPLVAINSDHFPTNAEANKTVVKNFRVKIMNGVGHFVMIEDPTTFNSLLMETIDEFLNN